MPWSNTAHRLWLSTHPPLRGHPALSGASPLSIKGVAVAPPSLRPPIGSHFVTTVPFEDFYRSSMAELGIPIDPEHALEEPLPPSLPAALAAYHRIAGRHPINKMDNVLLTPNELEREDQKLVFAIENQGVVIWGIDESDDADDPEVWQGQPSGLSWDDGGVVWYSEELPLSRFIIEMFTFAVTGEVPDRPPTR